MSVLLLRLAGPLQSWGSASRFARRDTEHAPTKSGVLGLLAGALGRPRDADLSDLVALRFGVRIDQPGQRLRDFHTAHHAESGRAMPVSERYYLADAIFVAGLEGDSVLLGQLYDALLEPHFLPYLGRRSCPPSRPVHMGPPRDTDLDTALEDTGWQASDWYVRRLERGRSDGGEAAGTGTLERLIESPANEADFALRDQPLSFDPHHRRYGLRGVRGDRRATPPRPDKAARPPSPQTPPPHEPTTGLPRIGP